MTAPFAPTCQLHGPGFRRCQEPATHTVKTTVQSVAGPAHLSWLACWVHAVEIRRSATAAGHKPTVTEGTDL